MDEKPDDGTICIQSTTAAKGASIKAIPILLDDREPLSSKLTTIGDMLTDCIESILRDHQQQQLVRYSLNKFHTKYQI